MALEAGPDAPSIVTAYIEMTPFDMVKYELDKETGYVRVDRPHRSSAQLPPSMVSFRAPSAVLGWRGLSDEGVDRADGDPLDICVVSERPISHSDIILNARVVGGLQMIDGGEADDKIVAVFEKDLFWGQIQDISDLPEILVERLTHYFSTYKLVPGTESSSKIVRVYDREHAHSVVKAAMEDYTAEYGGS